MSEAAIHLPETNTYMYHLMHIFTFFIIFRIKPSKKLQKKYNI